ncbi:MAG: AI-2E family transporter [Cytophagaceae bacterium]|nr:AI-2E family transporter [Cytophagaceae bacterium]
MENSKLVSLPIYSKIAQIILAILALGFLLYIGRDILVPILFATILAILLNPIVNFLTSKKLNRIFAIVLSLIITMLLVLGVLYFLGSQLALLSDSFPLFKQKFITLFHDTTQWISTTFNISNPKIDAWISKTQKEGLSNGTAFVGQTLGTVGGILAMMFLLPVYIFMILLYKSLLINFIYKVFKSSSHKVVAEILKETKSLIQSYLVGLLIEAGIVATLNSVALMIIGVPYAILIGVIGAILNIIPYIGGLVAVTIPIVLAFATLNPVSAFWVLIAYLIVQFIDNNFLVPKIVASKVEVNALISIIVVLIGGSLWGVAGMFLSIPLTAILKVIFDRIEGLEAFGFLIGDGQPRTTKGKE